MITHLHHVFDWVCLVALIALALGAVDALLAACVDWMAPKRGIVIRFPERRMSWRSR